MVKVAKPSCSDGVRLVEPQQRPFQRVLPEKPALGVDDGDRTIVDRRSQTTNCQLGLLATIPVDEHRPQSPVQQVETWIGKQTTQLKRIGVLADWANEYKTKAPAFEADILRTFASFVEQGLVYRSKKPVYWSIPFETALAEAEIEYKEHISIAIWVKFVVPAAEAQKYGLPTDKPLSIVIWTTTPWTIPANLAIALHPEVDYVVADLGTDEGRTAVYTLCCRTGIDMLINNAGISDFAPLEEQQPETICQMIHTNLLAPILLTQSLLPLLKMARAGMVINIGSTFGTIGYPGFSAYSATKFGLRGFTEALRRELGDSTISVRYLSPRATRTDMNSDIVNEMNCALGNATDTPEQVAVALKLLITGKKQSLYLGWPEKLFVRINSLFPSLVDGAIAKQLSTILAFARRARSIL